MAFDVEIREVRSWEVKVLLRNEASESDTHRTVLTNLLGLSNKAHKGHIPCF